MKQKTAVIIAFSIFVVLFIIGISMKMMNKSKKEKDATKQTEHSN